jgi:hypothetical protein
MFEQTCISHIPIFNVAVLLVAGSWRFAVNYNEPVTSNIATPSRNQVSGGHRAEVTPVPIPNTAVKLCIADDTARATAWESRTPPG